MNSILDTEQEKSNCFYACGPALVTGSTLGKIHAFDLLSSKRLGESNLCHGINMICDIKSFGQSLIGIDWRGLIVEWHWEYCKSKQEMNFTVKRTFYPPMGDEEEISIKYKNRYTERLIDYNDIVGATNCK